MVTQLEPVHSPRGFLTRRPPGSQCQVETTRRDGRITAEDDQNLEFARRLIRRGRAVLPGVGTWRSTLDRNVRDVLKPRRNGRLARLRMNPSSWPLGLADRTLDLGPVTILFTNLLPVESVTAVELGFEHVIPFDERSTLTVIRPQLPPP